MLGHTPKRNAHRDEIELKNNDFGLELAPEEEIGVVGSAQ